ncbi:MAG: helix-turn-helix transcriptional regulator [Blastocatellia bacterium]
MSKESKKLSFEQKVLLVVKELERTQQGAFGLSVFKRLKELNIRIIIGSIYITLDELEKEGFLHSGMTRPLPERGNRRKQLFFLTEKGLAAIDGCFLEKQPSLLERLKDKIFPVTLILCLHLTAFTACAQAQGNKLTMAKTNAGKEQVGNMFFVTPKNWEKLNNNGQVILVAPNTNGSTIITILPSERVYGSLETWFKNFLANNQKGKKLLSGGQINKGFSDEGYSVFSSEAVLLEKDSSESYRLYVVAQPDNVELVALISTNKSDYDKYKSIFEQFVYSLDFANIKNTNARSDNNPTVFEPSPNTNSRNNRANTSTSISSNSISGLFVGTISRQQFNPNTKFYDYIVRQQYYLFGPGGKVYFGLPSGNIRDIDQACQQDPGNCGEYQLSGSQLQLFRQGQQAQSFNLIKTNNGFKLGNNRFYPINSFDGLRLSGTYSFRSFTNLSGGAGGVSGGVGGERTISFNSNGQFVANNFVGFSGSGGVAQAASSITASGQGRYQINQNTITLSYSNGREEQFIFFVYPENEQDAKPGLIVIGGVSYLLRN